MSKHMSALTHKGLYQHAPMTLRVQRDVAGVGEGVKYLLDVKSLQEFSVADVKVLAACAVLGCYFLFSSSRHDGLKKKLNMLLLRSRSPTIGEEALQPQRSKRDDMHALVQNDVDSLESAHAPRGAQLSQNPNGILPPLSEDKLVTSSPTRESPPEDQALLEQEAMRSAVALRLAAKQHAEDLESITQLLEQNRRMSLETDLLRNQVAELNQQLLHTSRELSRLSTPSTPATPALESDKFLPSRASPSQLVWTRVTSPTNDATVNPGHRDAVFVQTQSSPRTDRSESRAVDVSAEGHNHTGHLHANSSSTLTNNGSATGTSSRTNTSAAGLGLRASAAEHLLRARYEVGGWQHVSNPATPRSTSDFSAFAVDPPR